MILSYLLVLLLYARVVGVAAQFKFPILVGTDQEASVVHDAHFHPGLQKLLIAAGSKDSLYGGSPTDELPVLILKNFDLSVAWQKTISSPSLGAQYAAAAKIVSASVGDFAVALLQAKDRSSAGRNLVQIFSLTSGSFVTGSVLTRASRGFEINSHHLQVREVASAIHIHVLQQDFDGMQAETTIYDFKFDGTTLTAFKPLVVQLATTSKQTSFLDENEDFKVWFGRSVKQSSGEVELHNGWISRGSDPVASATSATIKKVTKNYNPKYPSTRFPQMEAFGEQDRHGNIIMVGTYHAWNTGAPSTLDDVTLPVSESRGVLFASIVYEYYGLKTSHSEVQMDSTMAYPRAYKVLQVAMATTKKATITIFYQRIVALVEATWVDNSGTAHRSKEVVFIQVPFEKGFCTISIPRYAKSTQVEYITTDDPSVVSPTSQTLGGQAFFFDSSNIGFLVFGFVDLPSSDYQYNIGFIDSVALAGEWDEAVTIAQIETWALNDFAGSATNQNWAVGDTLESTDSYTLSYSEITTTSPTPILASDVIENSFTTPANQVSLALLKSMKANVLLTETFSTLDLLTLVTTSCSSCSFTLTQEGAPAGAPDFLTTFFSLNSATGLLTLQASADKQALSGLTYVLRLDELEASTVTEKHYFQVFFKLCLSSAVAPPVSFTFAKDPVQSSYSGQVEYTLDTSSNCQNYAVAFFGQDCSSPLPGAVTPGTLSVAGSGTSIAPFSVSENTLTGPGSFSICTRLTYDFVADSTTIQDSKELISQVTAACGQENVLPFSASSIQECVVDQLPAPQLLFTVPSYQTDTTQCPITVQKSISFANSTISSSWTDATKTQAEILNMEGRALSIETATFTFTNANTPSISNSAPFTLQVGCSSSTGAVCLGSDQAAVPSNWTEAIQFVIFDEEHEPETSKTWLGSVRSIFAPMLCVDRIEIKSPTNQGAYRPISFIKLGSEWHLQVNRTLPLGPTIVKAFACDSSDRCTPVVNLGRFEVVDNKTLNLDYVVLNRPPSLSGSPFKLTLLAEQSSPQAFLLPAAIDLEGDTISASQISLGELSLFCKLKPKDDLQLGGAVITSLASSSSDLPERSSSLDLALFCKAKIPSIDNQVQISFRLQDDNGDQPKASEEYFLQVTIKTPQPLVIVKTPEPKINLASIPFLGRDFSGTDLKGDKASLKEAELTEFGVFKLTFGQRFVLQDPARINRGVLDLAVVNGAENDEQSQIADWSCTEFTAEHLVIHIHFNDFTLVSHKAKDTMVVTVRDNSFFELEASEDNGKSRNLEEGGRLEEGFTFQVKMTKQMEPKPEIEVLVGSITSTVSAVEASLLTTTAVNLISQQSLNQVFCLVNILQMIVHLPMLRTINFPRNLEAFYARLLPIATFDFLPSEYSTDLLFTFSEEQELDEDEYQEYLLLDYESHNSIPNLGSVFYFMAFTVFCFITWVLLLILRWCFSKQLNFTKSLKNYVSNSSIVLGIESAIEMLVCLYLNTQSIELSTWGDRLSLVTSALGGLWLVLLLIFLILKIVLITPEQSQMLESDEMQQAIGGAYEEIKTRSPAARAFNVVFLLRRTFFIGIIITFRDNTAFQVMLMVASSQLTAIYLAWAKPFKSPGLRRIEQFNEVTIVVASGCLSLFTDFVPSTKEQYRFGWGVIIFFMGNMLINIGYTMYLSLAEFLWKCKRYFQRRKLARTQLSKVQEEPTPAPVESFELTREPTKCIIEDISLSTRTPEATPKTTPKKVLSAESQPKKVPSAVPEFSAAQSGAPLSIYCMPTLESVEEKDEESYSFRPVDNILDVFKAGRPQAKASTVEEKLERYSEAFKIKDVSKEQRIKKLVGEDPALRQGFKALKDYTSNLPASELNKLASWLEVRRVFPMYSRSSQDQKREFVRLALEEAWRKYLPLTQWARKRDSFDQF